MCLYYFCNFYTQYGMIESRDKLLIWILIELPEFSERRKSQIHLFSPWFLSELYNTAGTHQITVDVVFARIDTSSHSLLLKHSEA
jgi:hypothetical protein